MDIAGAGNLVVGSVWCAFEIGLARLRRSSSTQGTQSSDQHSLRVLWGTIAVSMSAGITLGMFGVGRIPSAWPTLAFVGQAMMVAGLAIRVVAVRTLSKFFTVDVAIHEDHRVIKEGIYSLVRHPSYAGSVLGFAGVGLCFASWVSFLVIAIPVTAAFVHRIRIEERALLDALGPAYAEYCKQTSRLIPRIY